jgi:hypothetical protein
MIRPDMAFAISQVKEYVVDGKKLVVIEAFGKTGRLRRQSLISRAWQETTIDYNGDGAVDRWEFSANGTEMRASEPMRGQFMNLEVRQRLQRGTLQLSYIYHRPDDTYHLLTSRFHPDRVMKKTNLAVGQLTRSCSVYDDQLESVQKAWNDILDRLSTEGFEQTRQALIKSMTENEKLIFHPDCFNGEFAKSIDAMIQGMADVMMSDRTKAKPSKYFACLSEPEVALTQHVSRIENDLYTHSALFISSQVGPSSSAPHILCAERADRDGSFNPGATPQVVFHTPITKLDPEKSAREQYASTYFHELLHDSQIDEDKETLVENLESCCSDGYKSGVESCENAKRIIGEELVKNSYQAAYADAYSGFEMWRKSVGEKLDPLIGENMVSNYFLQLDEYTTGELATQMFDCVKSGKGQAACQAEYDKALEKFPERYFNTSCKVFAVQAGKPDSVCQEIYSGFQAMLRSTPSVSSANPAGSNTEGEAASGAQATQQPAAGASSGSGSSSLVVSYTEVNSRARSTIDNVMGGNFNAGGSLAPKATVSDSNQSDIRASTAGNKTDPQNVGNLRTSPVSTGTVNGRVNTANRATAITNKIKQAASGLVGEQAFAQDSSASKRYASSQGVVSQVRAANMSPGRNTDPSIKMAVLSNPRSALSGLQTSSFTIGNREPSSVAAKTNGAEAGAVANAAAKSADPKAGVKASGKQTGEVVGGKAARVEREKRVHEPSTGLESQRAGSGNTSTARSDRNTASSERFKDPASFFRYLTSRDYASVKRSMGDADVEWALEHYDVYVSERPSVDWGSTNARHQFRYDESLKHLVQVK